jgi:predicted RNA-binding Zn ribbon-like protein
MSSAAPGSLETVRAFVNTFDIERDVDALSTPATLGAWLSDAGLLDDQVAPTTQDLEHAITLREAFRSALVSNHDRSPVPSVVLTRFDETAARARLVVSFTPDRDWTVRPGARGVDGAFGLLLSITAAAMTDKTWQRLKVCANDSCRWAFYDSSRARSGKWCSMSLCGNRSKQQAWRARHDTN